MLLENKMSLENRMNYILVGISILKGFVTLYSTFFLIMKYFFNGYHKTKNLIEFIQSIDHAIVKFTIAFSLLLGIEFILKGLIDLNKISKDKVNSDLEKH